MIFRDRRRRGETKLSFGGRWMLISRSQIGGQDCDVTVEFRKRVI